MSTPILISISPNTDWSDVWVAFKTFLNPIKWQIGQSTIKLSKKLSKLLDHKHTWLLNAGRNALKLGLQALDLSSSDEVLCQAFTCVAVPNAIKWAGAKSVYVDTVKNGFNISLRDLKAKITPNSKAVIVQHTFGNPDDLKQIKKICQQHDLTLIEDCAHTLGVRYQNKPIGSFGDLSILSFGRDKAISSVFGGALLTSNAKLAKKIDQHYHGLKQPSKLWIFKQLLHPLVMAIAKPYYFSFGKYLIFVYQKSGLLSWPVTQKEKKCQESLLPKQLPNSLAILALQQLKKLKDTNQTRLKAVQSYQAIFKVPNFKSFPLLRFPLLVSNPQQLIKIAKKAKILLGDWYRPVIAPTGVNLTKVGYQTGSCPNAEKVSQKVVNLPTNISNNQVNQVINLVNQHVDH